MPLGSQLSRDPSSLVGLWYLTGSQDDERAVPAHRVVIRFDIAAGRLRGAVIAASRDIPLGDLTFNGSLLSFRLLRSSNAGLEPVTILPYMLVLKIVTDDRFEGSWMKSQTESVGIPLKLWRAHPSGYSPETRPR